jgi:hypothetical protein
MGGTLFQNPGAGKREGGGEAGAGTREPKSLLTATSEQLERIAAGTGQAVTQGAAGAKQALSRTWEERATNEELHKGLEFGVKAAGLGTPPQGPRPFPPSCGSAPALVHA